MRVALRIISMFLMLIVAQMGFSQDNSPWKEFGSKVISGVYTNTGCHEYSLTNGQGFNVYLKNTGIQAVNVTGQVVAKTVCGNDVSSQFSVNLAPGQVSNGSDFFQGGNGQTGVVKPEDCKGVRYAKLPYSKFINRIKSVSVANVKVTPLSDSSFIALPGGTTSITTSSVSAPSISTPSVSASVPSVTTTGSAIKQAVTDKVNTYVPSNIRKVKFDSLGYYKNLFNHNQDSLTTLVSNLQTQNLSLLDSINAVKLNSIKLAAQKEGTIAPLYNAVPNTTFTLQAGIGWDKLPIILNQDSALPGQSMTGNSSHPLLQLSGILGLMNNKSISLALTPFFTYGFNIKSGEQGSHLTYGLKADVLFALGKGSPLKALASVGYTGRNGNYTFTGTQLQKADYNYGLIHYGLGLRYTEAHNKYWLQPGLYYDAPTTTPIYGSTPFMVVNLEAGIGTKWQIGLSYGKDYFAHGNLKYPINFYQYNQDYFGLRILHNFRLL